MGKKLIIPIIIGVLVIVLAVLYFFLPSSGTFSQIKDQTGNLASKLQQDLGPKSTTDQADILADPQITAASIKNSKTYQDLLKKFGILPEQLLANKLALEDLKSKGTDIPSSPKIDFQLSFASDLAKSIEDQAKQIASTGQLPIYSFQTSFDDDFYKTLASGFGISKDQAIITKDDATGYYLISNFKTEDKTNPDALKLISFNPASGSFSLIQTPTDTQTKTATSATPQVLAQNFLFNNPALKQYTTNLDQSETTTYQRKDTPGITYVAFHRGWKPLPILNIFGVQSIASLASSIKQTITEKANLAFLTPDDQITDTSDNLNGYARADDFNTITIAVENKAGTILGSNFNIRPTTDKATQTTLVSAKDALVSAQNGDIYQSILIPEGDGTPNAKTLYPNNLASSKDAQITSVYLSYIEEPLDKLQSYLQPVYVFKGTATLSSNYKVDFSFATPATKPDQKLALTNFLEVQADQASDQTTPNSQIQVGAVNAKDIPGKVVNGPSQTPQSTPTNTPTVSTGQTNTACSADLKQCEIKKIIEFEGTIFSKQPFDRLFALVPVNQKVDKGELFKIQQSFMDKCNAKVAGEGQLYECQSMYKGLQLSMYRGESPNSLRKTEQCCYKGNAYNNVHISGTSPLVYLYSSKPTAFDVLPSAKDGMISFTYPAREDSLWKVVADSLGNLTYNGQNYQNLYYEFTHKDINIPATGYIVAKDQAKDFLQNILLPKLNLNQKEIDDYLADINTHVFTQTKSETNYYKISLLPKDEIERLLPLQTTPAPALSIRNLLHFEQLILRPNYQITRPKLPDAVNRSDYESVLVEDGAVLR